MIHILFFFLLNSLFLSGLAMVSCTLYFGLCSKCSSRFLDVAYSTSLFTDIKWQDKCGGWFSSEQMLAFQLCKWQFMGNNREGMNVGGGGGFHFWRLQPLALNSLLHKSKDSVQGACSCHWNLCPALLTEQNFCFRYVIYPPPPSSHSLPDLMMTGSKTSHRRCKLGQ